MANIVKKVVIKVDAKDADKELQDVKDALNSTEKELKSIEKEAPRAGKSFQSMADGAKKVATGMKSILAAGGVILLLNTLKDLFMQNAKVAEAFENAMAFLQIIVNKVVEVFTNTIEKASKLTGGFDAMKKVVMNLLNIALTPLKLAFYGINLAINEIQLAWENSIFGGKDEDKIKKLTENIKNAKNNLIEVGKSAIESGKQVATNIGEAVGEVITLATTAYEEGAKVIEKTDLKLEMSRAKSLKETQRNAQAAIALAQSEIDRLEGVAEKYRQIRDDSRLSFSERLEASKNLNKAIDEQYQAMLNLANVNLSVANANYELVSSAENYAAVVAANTEVVKAQADIEGKRSEQIMSEIGLLKEQEDLIKSLEQSKNDRLKAQLERDVSLTKSLSDRYNSQIELENKVYVAEKERLLAESVNNKISETERKMALDALITLEQNHVNVLNSIDKEYYDNRSKMVMDSLNMIQNSEKINFNDRIEANKAYQEEIIKNEWMTEEEKTKALFENSQKRADLQQQERLFNLDLAKQSIASLQAADQNFTESAINRQQRLLNEKKISQEEFDKQVAKIQKKAAVREKFYAVSNAIIDTSSAIIRMLADPGGVAGTVLSIGAGITGLAQITKILSTPVDGNSYGGANINQPTFNVPSSATPTIPTTSFTFADQNIQPQTTDNQVIKTYVITKDISSAQELDRNIISNALI